MFIRRGALFCLLLLAACSPQAAATQVTQPAKIMLAASGNGVNSISPTATAKEPVFPIRAAFYYPWFPEAWSQQGMDPFTNYHPALGFYDSGSTAVIDDHIREMAYAHIDAAILSWWGQGTPTDQRVGTILAATPGSSDPAFRWALYYEQEGQGDPSVEMIKSDLEYIQNHYGNDPSFLRIDGRFVIFVYNNGNDTCSMADRWVQADGDLGHPAYIDLKIFPGYRKCASQPDSWHQYAPASSTNELAGNSYTISPGFWLAGQAVRLVRSQNAWAASVTAMVASNEPWQLITTFNEWGEGTAIEPAQEWTSASGYGTYLDTMNKIIP